MCVLRCCVRFPFCLNGVLLSWQRKEELWRRYKKHVVDDEDLLSDAKLGRTTFLEICTALTVKEIQHRGAIDGVSHSCGALNFAYMLQLLDSIDTAVGTTVADVAPLVCRARKLVAQAQVYLKTEYRQHVRVALSAEDITKTCCTHSPYYGLCMCLISPSLSP